MKVLFIGNSMHSLPEEFEKKGCEALVCNNNTDMRIIDNTVKKFKPNLIVVSGLGSIKNSGNSIDAIRSYYEKIPIFGVGLGYLCIINVFEGKVDKIQPMFGKPLKIKHDGKTIFNKIENPFQAGSYSSLAAVDVPYIFEVSARDENDIVMGVRHKEHFVEGIQFDPASILTPAGGKIIENLINGIKK